MHAWGELAQNGMAMREKAGSRSHNRMCSAQTVTQPGQPQRRAWLCGCRNLNRRPQSSTRCLALTRHSHHAHAGQTLQVQHPEPYDACMTSHKHYRQCSQVRTQMRWMLAAPAKELCCWGVGHVAACLGTDCCKVRANRAADSRPPGLGCKATVTCLRVCFVLHRGRARSEVGKVHQVRAAMLDAPLRCRVSMLQTCLHVTPADL